MKKAFILSFVLLFAFAANAQNYKKFRVGAGIGYAMASGNGASGGILAALEPSYRVQDNLAIGLRFESAVITRGFSEDIGTINIDVAGIGSYTLNGQYYVSAGSSFRPFVGAGMGLYSLAAVKVSSDGQSGEAAAAASKFGFYPRAGFDIGHFSMVIDYNLIPATAVEGTDGEFKNSYIGMRLGFFVGGGKL